jgi:hypothetical protein
MNIIALIVTITAAYSVQRVQSLLNVTGEFLFCEYKISKNINANDICFDKVSCEKIAIMQKSKDEFHYFKSQARDLVIYSNNNQFSETTCEKVNQIIIQDVIKSNICMRDLFVAFKLKNKFELGFMTKHGILRKKTLEIECINNPQIFQTPNKSHTIIKRNNSISFSFVSENLINLNNSTNSLFNKSDSLVSTNSTNLFRPKKSAYNQQVIEKSISEHSLEVIQLILSSLAIVIFLFFKYQRTLCKKKSDEIDQQIVPVCVETSLCLEPIKEINIKLDINLEYQKQINSNYTSILNIIQDNLQQIKLIDTKFENWSNAFENKLKQNSKSDTNKHASTPINNVKPSFELKNELLESELLNFSKDIQNMKVRKNENI